MSQGLASQLQASSAASNAAGDVEDDDEEEQLDVEELAIFADRVQYIPGQVRPHIVIPKRGEKDFEPLVETVNLQEMMLQRSRESLFSALQGVRGGASKSLSHAVIDPSSSYPRLILQRGHILDSMGVTVRDRKGKGKARTELLPEEALFLLERGSLQIWTSDVNHAEWEDENYGPANSVMMSVMEGYATFIGADHLSWEKYQAYAYLKRLGYTVHRTSTFLPEHMKPIEDPPSSLPPFRTWWFSIPGWLASFSRLVWRSIRRLWSQSSVALLSDWRGASYNSLYRCLRIIPSSWQIMRRVSRNPYQPFFHVWKPATAWSKIKWDRGSRLGLERQPPDYWVTAVDARHVPLPTASQIAEIFKDLPDLPSGPTRRQGPQYRQPASAPRSNPIAQLRNGDRAFVVAVNDSGNTGWVRFGRSGFAGLAMI